MTLQLIIGLEAHRDIEESGLYYESRRVGLGDRFLAEVDDLLLRVSSNPLQFPEVGDRVRRGLLRRFPYAVYFLVDKQAVTVLACLHQHRRPGAWIKEELEMKRKR